MPPKGSKGSKKPKSSQQSQQSSSQSASLPQAVKKVCDEIENAKKRNVPITASETLSALKEALRKQRKDNSNVSIQIAGQLVKTLDSGGNDICSRLDAAVFSVAIETFLQSTPSRDGERGLQMLGASLYRDSKKPGRAVEKRKDVIGKDCMHRLLDHFVDTDKHDGMRRWAGILCLQLLRGSGENRQLLELGPEDTRRCIGKLVVEEPNEIIKLLCGQLVRVLGKAGIPLKDLWPVDYQENFYVGFPASSQKGHGWNELFQNYVDQIWEMLSQPDTGSYVCFANSFRLKPDHSFGAPDHNVNIWIEGDLMTALALSSENTMEQILEVPLSSIRHIKITFQDFSQQRGVADVVLELENHKGTSCYLDATPTDLQRIEILAELQSMKGMRDFLITWNPEINTTEQPQEPASTDRSNADELQASQRTSTAEEGVQLAADGTPTQEFMQTSTSQETIVFSGGADPKQKVSVSERQSRSQAPEGAPLGDETAATSDGEQGPATQDEPDPEKEDLYGASPRRRSQPSAPEAGLGPSEKVTAEQTVGKPQKPKKPLVKPKAKTPIVQSQRQSNLNRSRAEDSVSASTSRPQVAQKELPKFKSVKPTPAKQGEEKQDAKTRRANQSKAGAIEDDIESSPLATKRVPLKPSAKGASRTQTKAPQSNTTNSKFTTDEITSPDINDSSTPKPKRPVGRPPKKLAAAAIASSVTANDTQTRSQKLKDDFAAAAIPPKKRYSLHGGSRSQPNQPKVSNLSDIPEEINAKDGREAAKAKPKPKRKTIDGGSRFPGNVAKGDDVYDFPEENDPEKKGRKGKTKAKQNSMKDPPTATNGATKGAKTTKANVKKRQSAPAALERTIASTRNSQRAAATKANARLHDADMSDEDEIEEVQDEVIEKSKAKGKKASKTQARAEPPPKVEAFRTSNSVESEGDEDDHIMQVQEGTESDAPQEEDDDVLHESLTKDAISLGLINGQISNADTDAEQDARREGQVAAKPPVKSKDARQGKGTESQKQNAQKSKLDVAEKLGEAFDFDSEAEHADNQQILHKQPRPTTKKRPIVPANSQQQASDAMELPGVAEANKQGVPKPSRSSRLEQGPNGVVEDRMPSATSKPDAKKLDIDVEYMFRPRPDKEEANQAAEKKRSDNESIVAPLPKPSQLAKANGATEVKAADVEGIASKPIVLSLEKEFLKPEISPGRKNRKSYGEAPMEDSEEYIGEDTIVVHEELVPSRRSSIRDDDFPATVEAPTEGSNGIVNKRKPAVGDAAPSKRQKIREGPVAKKPSPSPTRSPKEKRKSQRTMPEASRREKRQSPVPARRSPRLAERVKTAAGATDHQMLEKPLVDERLVRKPNVISFGAQGPLNQGGNASGSSVRRPNALNPAIARNAAAVQDALAPKRKREEVEPIDQSSDCSPPPQKRQSLSPSEANSVDEVDDDGFLVLTCSLPKVASSPVSARPGLRKPRSQGSRVDINGSPLPAPSQQPVDYIGRLRTKLKEDIHFEKPRTKEETRAEKVVEQRARRPSQIFGPKVQLGNQPTARPTSPDKPAPRYVPHRKTVNGHYVEVNTKEVVEEQKALPDPFADANQKPSHFTERLRTASANDTFQEERSERPKTSRGCKVNSVNNFEVEDLPRQHHQSSKANFKPRQNDHHRQSRRVTIQDPEKTLVDDEPPSDMTSGSSWESRSSQESRSPLEETAAPNQAWNVALRPHYKTLSDALHRIADEVIIRLAEEEDRMDLLVEQYRENGSKLLGKLDRKRKEDRIVITQKLELKKSDMISAYNEARNFVVETEGDLKDNPIVVFEKEWRKTQQVIQKSVSKGRGMFE